MDCRSLVVALALVCSTRAAAQAPAKWTLTQTLRIGGADEGPTSFNYIKSIAVDNAGRMFVYDRQSKDIRVFGADGKFVKTFSRLGSGPGEMRDAEGIAFASDGSLWMRDAANARITIFNADGTYRDGWTMTFCSSQGRWFPQNDGKGRLVAEDCVVKDGESVGRAILAYHIDRSRIDTISPMPQCGERSLGDAATYIVRSGSKRTFYEIPFAPRSLTALGPQGEVWCVPNSGAYGISRIVPGARDTVRASRGMTGPPLSAAERSEIITRFAAGTADGLAMSRVPTTKPVIHRIDTDGNGRLWVMRPVSNGAMELDVVDPSGRALATMSLGRVKVSTYTPFTVRGDAVYLVVLDEDDVPYVARYNISR